MTNLKNANLIETNLKDVDLWGTIGDGNRIQTHKLGIYKLSIYDDRIQIGCKNHSFEEWMSFSDEEIDRMDEVWALDWWKEYKDEVVRLYKRYRNQHDNI